MTTSYRARRIGNRIGVASDVVQRILDEDAALDYPLGTVLRWSHDGNMAIKTPDGWKGIPNTTFRIEGLTMTDGDLKGWHVVYNPDVLDISTAEQFVPPRSK